MTAVQIAQQVSAKHDAEAVVSRELKSIFAPDVDLLPRFDRAEGGLDSGDWWQLDQDMAEETKKAIEHFDWSRVRWLVECLDRLREIDSAFWQWDRAATKRLEDGGRSQGASACDAHEDYSHVRNRPNLLETTTECRTTLVMKEGQIHVTGSIW